MILVLDVGNSQIYCGVFDRGELSVQFRYASTSRSSSDEIGVFLRGALRENGVAPEAIETIGISSVVPELNYTLWARRVSSPEPTRTATAIHTTAVARVYQRPSAAPARRRVTAPVSVAFTADSLAVPGRDWRSRRATIWR